MKFKNALLEYAPEIPLKTWNNAQIELWQYVVDTKKASMHDMKKFHSFASFFDNFFKQHKKFPTHKEVEKIF